MAKGMCKCRWDMLIVALVLTAIGFACLVNGAVTQFNEADSVAWWKFGIAYLVGFALLGFAKMAKWKAVEPCAVHKK